ncbi:MAG: YqaJ viral recombinase family protein [Ghiorsea sp.]
MFIDIQQNTDEWLDMRAGKVTGSAIASVMANYGKAFGEPAKKYAVNIAVERINNKRIQGERYSNAHMEAGHIEEPIARGLYCQQKFNRVDNGGFYDNGNTGCSPDGLVGKHGMVEIKSVIPSVHYKAVEKGKFDAKYRWQIAFNLKETGRDWLDYISFCAVFPETKRLVSIRVTKEQMAEEFTMIDERLAEFETLIASITCNIQGETP